MREKPEVRRPCGLDTQESGQGLKPAVLAQPGIHQQRAPSQSAARSVQAQSLQDSLAGWGVPPPPGLSVEGEADFFLETLSVSGGGTALPRTRVSPCKLQSSSGALVWKGSSFGS